MAWAHVCTDGPKPLIKYRTHRHSTNKPSKQRRVTEARGDVSAEVSPLDVRKTEGGQQTNTGQTEEVLTESRRTKTDVSSNEKIYHMQLHPDTNDAESQ